MSEHALKTWPAYFDAVADGRKRFEVRSTRDRTFAVGDVLVLREWDPQTEAYSGRSVRVVVTFMVEGAPFLPEGTAVLSIDPAHEWVPGGRERNGLDVCKHCGVDDAVAWYAAPAGGDRLVQCVTKGEGR